MLNESDQISNSSDPRRFMGGSRDLSKQHGSLPIHMLSLRRVCAIYIDVVSIDIDIIDIWYPVLDSLNVFMGKQRKTPEALHTLLVMVRTSHWITRYLLPPILEAGLGDSDFRVLHVLVDNGPTPVNAIGPKVHLNPGSISVAVDRLFKKGLVSRVESEADRRVRTVSITEKGRDLFLPLLRQQAALVERTFRDVSPQERGQLEDMLKRIGRRAKALAGAADEGTDRSNE